MGSELTPEEIAHQIVLDWAAGTLSEHDLLEDRIAAAIRLAAQAQRERDAGIAETEADSAGRVYGEARDAAFNIAAAIRKQA